jgi:hypothetical protein
MVLNTINMAVAIIMNQTIVSHLFIKNKTKLSIITMILLVISLLHRFYDLSNLGPHLLSILINAA